MTACDPAPPPPFTIAAASSFRGPLEKVVEAYQRATGDSCRIVYGSSGKLSAQIEAGAPFDVFLSADDVYSTKLAERGLSLSPPYPFARGQLAVWSFSGYEISLGNDDIRHIALPNPETAPYGVAARAYLKKAGLWEELSPKLVLGESVSQAGQFVTSGSAEVGITALSVIRSLKKSEQGGYVVLPLEMYPAITQTYLAIRQGRLHAGGQDFYKFLQTTEAREILREFGYLTPPVSAHTD